jgi:endonuclease/exonuclease/phosphatase (EEP) superfamily protein YafD
MKAMLAALKGFAAAGCLALGLACLVFASYAWGGRDDGRLDVLTHFAPVYLAGGLVAATTALCLRLRWLRLVLALPGLGAAIAAGGLVGPEFVRPASPRAPADAPRQLKLIQFNSWHAYNVDPEGTGRWIAEQDADVVVMEEAEQAVIDAVLRHRTYHVTGSKKAVTILSRAKPVASKVPWPRPKPLAATGLARFAEKDGGFTIVGVHYTWPTQWERQEGQSNDTIHVLRDVDLRRAILVGDFNSTPWSFARRRQDARLGLERRTRALATWPARIYRGADQGAPAPFPFLPIDHVYAGSDWRTVSVTRGPRLGSDHYPVIVTLALEPS